MIYMATLRKRGLNVGIVSHGTLGRKAHQTVLGTSLGGTHMDPVLLQASSHLFVPCPITAVVVAQNNVLWESISQLTKLGDRN